MKLTPFQKFDIWLTLSIYGVLVATEHALGCRFAATERMERTFDIIDVLRRGV